MQKARKRKTRNRTFWTEQKAQAARLVFDGAYTDREIAEQLGVGARTLSRWKTHPEFRGHLDTLFKTYEQESYHLSLETARSHWRL